MKKKRKGFFSWFTDFEQTPSPEIKEQTPKLREFIPNYQEWIEKQILMLQESIDMLQEDYSTSLDIILAKSIDTIKNGIAEYTKIIERVLTGLKIITPNFDPHRRNLTEFVYLAQSQARFYGGDKVLEVHQFIKNIQNEYISDLDDYSVLKYTRNLKQELELLGLFIMRN